MAEDAARAQAEASRAAQTVLESPAKSSMGPPDSVPRRAGRAKRVLLESPDASSSNAFPQPMQVDDPASSSPIKAPAKRGGRLQKASSSKRNDVDTSPTPAKARTRRTTKARIAEDSDSDESPKEKPAGKKGKSGSTGNQDRSRGKKKRKITNSPTSRALFQYEAERSTDEELHGSATRMIPDSALPPRTTRSRGRR